MRWRSRCAEGFSVIEVMVAFIGGLLLLVLAYWVLSTSAKVTARGQSKLADINQAELVFRMLESDLRAAREPVSRSDAAPQLTISREWLDEGRSSPRTIQVRWVFRGGPDGRGSYIDRVVEGGSDSNVNRLCAEMLSSFQLAPSQDSGVPGLAVKLEMKTRPDAQPAGFQETFYMPNLISEVYWNPVGAEQ